VILKTLSSASREQTKHWGSTRNITSASPISGVYIMIKMHRNRLHRAGRAVAGG
jgi:hypothetical protein